MQIMTIHTHQHQRGIALVASLMIMLILTILGITVMNMTTLEEKMAFNTQDRYMARYIAESAILFLASDAAAMVSGTAIQIDGGKALGVPPA